jgi:hypothetical protein
MAVIKTMATTNTDVQKLNICFSRFLNELENIGIKRPSIDIARVVFLEYLKLCRQNKHLCDEYCEEIAEKILSTKSQQQEFLRLLLPEIYDAYIPSCWDGCLACTHISQRVLTTGLTNHEQMLYVSKTLAHILLQLLTQHGKGGKQ